MTNLFFHELRQKKIDQFYADLAEFDKTKPEYDVVYDILEDIKAEYPGLYIHHLQTFTSISIPYDMTKDQFYKWLDYLESEYLAEYNNVRCDSSNGEIVCEYLHKDTNGKIRLEFNIPHCKYTETGKFVKETKVECNWD